MRAPSPPKIVIAGAGSVGCYVGGCLGLAGRAVTLLLRAPLAEAISTHGFAVRELAGAERFVAPDRLTLAVDPAAALAGASLVLVTTKSAATAEMATLILRHAPVEATVISLQNGVANVPAIERALGAGARVSPGMVPFNVVQRAVHDRPTLFHKATGGTVRMARQGAARFVFDLNVAGLPVALHDDMNGVLWSKLVINLNNAINALAGITLTAELGDRRWRLVLARQMQEALGILSKAGRATVALDGVHPKFLPAVLRLPDPVFRLVARRMLAIAPEARSSMWEDLERRRTTEIDYLQGEIRSLAAGLGIPVPLTDRVIALVKAAEARQAGSPRLQADDLWPGP